MPLLAAGAAAAAEVQERWASEKGRLKQLLVILTCASEAYLSVCRQLGPYLAILAPTCIVADAVTPHA